MSFTQETFALLSPHSTDTPRVYMYKSADDLATVTSPGYFSAKRFQVAENDMLFASLPDGVHSLSFVGSDGTCQTLGLGNPASVEIMINSISDLPDPVGGFIDIGGVVDGRIPVYRIGGAIDLGANRLRLAEDNFTIMLGVHPFATTLTSSTTDSLIVGTDSFFTISDVGMSAPAGRIYELEQDDGLCFVVERDCSHSALLPSSLDNLALASFFGSRYTALPGGAFAFSGANFGELLFSIVNFDSGIDGNILDFGSAVFNSVDILESRLVSTPSNNYMSGLLSSGNIVATSVAKVLGTRTVGTPPTFVNISPSDARWEFQGNNQITNSSKAADAFLTTSETVAIVQNVYSPVAGGNWQSEVSQRIEVDANGAMAVQSPVPAQYLITATSTVEKSGGGSDEVASRIAINGVAQPKTESSTDNNSPTSIVSQGLFTLVFPDVVQLYVTNKDSGSSVIVDLADVTMINGF